MSALKYLRRKLLDISFFLPNFFPHEYVAIMCDSAIFPFLVWIREGWVMKQTYNLSSQRWGCLCHCCSFENSASLKYCSIKCYCLCLCRKGDAIFMFDHFESFRFQCVFKPFCMNNVMLFHLEGSYVRSTIWVEGAWMCTHWLVFIIAYVFNAISDLLLMMCACIIVRITKFNLCLQTSRPQS